jgi:purine nucleosidase
VILYLDCDTGIDDALALALLLAQRPAVVLAGIGTVDGNTSARQAARNTLGLLALAGAGDVPVAVGDVPVAVRDVPGRDRRPVHGDNGAGGVELPAGAEPDPRTTTELLLDLAEEHASELHVLATGPCSNLAAALRASPALVTRVASVTVMGGAVRLAGTVTPVAEANIRADPRAAAEVLAAGWPVTLVPLDVTLRHRWTEHDRAALAAGPHPLHRALAAMLPAYFDSYEPRLGERAIPLHDPLAAAIAVGVLHPVDAPALHLRVDPREGAVRESTVRESTVRESTVRESTLQQGGVRESEAAPARTRVVFAVDRPAGPVLLEQILAAPAPRMPDE